MLTLIKTSKIEQLIRLFKNTNEGERLLYQLENSKDKETYGSTVIEILMYGCLIISYGLFDENYVNYMDKTGLQWYQLEYIERSMRLLGWNESLTTWE